MYLLILNQMMTRASTGGPQGVRVGNCKHFENSQVPLNSWCLGPLGAHSPWVIIWGQYKSSSIHRDPHSTN